MAILTRYGFEKLARRIMESGGMTEQMENDVRRLKDDFDEREGLLRKYGETYDGEDREEYEWKESSQLARVSDPDTSVLDDVSVPAKDWEAEYKSLRQRYLDRFFGKDVKNDDFEDIMENQVEDTIGDYGEKSIDSLLYGAHDPQREERK